jgi:8-oxo-dGTP pyrophosphatase MutT (NUDIX family)
VRARAAVILIQNDKIALIERCRSGLDYFVFPGGKVKTNESTLEAAAREAQEELGLNLKIGLMVAEVWYLGLPQFYFLAEPIGGRFGHGSGSEMNSTPDSEKGSYLPVWVEDNKLLNLPVLPKLMAEFVWKSHNEGWSRKPLMVTDRPPDIVKTI